MLLPSQPINTQLIEIQRNNTAYSGWYTAEEISATVFVCVCVFVYVCLHVCVRVDNLPSSMTKGGCPANIHWSISISRSRLQKEQHVHMQSCMCIHWVERLRAYGPQTCQWDFSWPWHTQVVKVMSHTPMPASCRKQHPINSIRGWPVWADPPMVLYSLWKLKGEHNNSCRTFGTVCNQLTRPLRPKHSVYWMHKLFLTSLKQTEKGSCNSQLRYLRFTSYMFSTLSSISEAKMMLHILYIIARCNEPLQCHVDC